MSSWESGQCWEHFCFVLKVEASFRSLAQNDDTAAAAAAALTHIQLNHAMF